MSSGTPESDADARTFCPHHFSRQPELETGDRIYVWRDVWPEKHGDTDDPSPITVWILENPLGMGKYGVRTDRIDLGDEIDDIGDSEHVAAPDTETEAKEAAIDWMTERCIQRKEEPS
ncbi:hypothetical protein [Halorhabdus tiamatea]|nr:hypothetical protein [Halorhabdus tiamatea]